MELRFNKRLFNNIYWEIDKWYNDTDIRYIWIYGGSSCFAGHQHIKTNRGDIQIKDIVIGDVVQTINETTKEIEEKKVIDTLKFDNNKKAFRIKLKNGEIIECTEDHKFLFNGGFTKIKDILYLKKNI